MKEIASLLRWMKKRGAEICIKNGFQKKRASFYELRRGDIGCAVWLDTRIRGDVAYADITCYIWSQEYINRVMRPDLRDDCEFYCVAISVDYFVKPPIDREIRDYETGRVSVQRLIDLLELELMPLMNSVRSAEDVHDQIMLPGHAQLSRRELDRRAAVFEGRISLEKSYTANLTQPNKEFNAADFSSPQELIIAIQDQLRDSQSKD